MTSANRGREELPICSKGGGVIYCYNLVPNAEKGGRGSKIPKIYLTSFVSDPLRKRVP